MNNTNERPPAAPQLHNGTLYKMNTLSPRSAHVHLCLQEDTPQLPSLLPPPRSCRPLLTAMHTCTEIWREKGTRRSRTTAILTLTWSVSSTPWDNHTSSSYPTTPNTSSSAREISVRSECLLMGSRTARPYLPSPLLLLHLRINGGDFSTHPTAHRPACPVHVLL